MRRASWVLLASIVCGPSLAQAHFLWVTANQEKGGGQTVQVYFSEGPDAGEVNLIEKIAHAKAWVRSAKGEPAEIKLSVKKEDEFGLLVGPTGASRVDCAEAACKFGVITRGEKSSLLHYHAKYLLASAANFKALGRSEKLPLDIVPQAGKEATEIDVLWQGKPAEGSQVVVVDPAGKQTKPTLDKQGRLSLSTTAPGRYAIRARWVEDKAGDEGGKAYAQRLYYTTLVLEIPAASDVK